jgi:S-adenosylmethionine:diacylglycerol 3-amino-3-carboxypropyl transferase
VNQCGATEKFYRYVGAALRASAAPDEVWRALVDCGSLDAQRELHARHFTGDAWRTAVRILLSKSTHLLFFPAFMFQNATEHDFGAFFARQFDREVREKVLFDNYFLWQFLFGRYLHDRPRGMPHYLEAYEETRRNAHKLRVVARPLEECLEEERGVEAFVLSNVFDWMSAPQRERLCAAILRAAAPRAQVIFRNMLSAPPLPQSFAERFAVDAEASRALHQMERSMAYQRVTTGVLP